MFPCCNVFVIVLLLYSVRKERDEVMDNYLEQV